MGQVARSVTVNDRRKGRESKSSMMKWWKTFHEGYSELFQEVATSHRGQRTKDTSLGAKPHWSYHFASCVVYAFFYDLQI